MHKLQELDTILYCRTNLIEINISTHFTTIQNYFSEKLYKVFPNLIGLKGPIRIQARTRISDGESYITSSRESRPDRSEFEYPIPLTDERIFLATIEMHIVKTRYKIPHHGLMKCLIGDINNSRVIVTNRATYSVS